MIFFQRKRLGFWNFDNLQLFVKKFMMYTNLVLLINGESRNSRRIMFMWYLVLHNTTKELCDIILD